MKRPKLLIIFFLIAAISSSDLYAYTERNLLQNSADLAKVKASLIMDQKWVPYPGYSDRQGWEDLMGEHKKAYIRRGEKSLNYTWQVVKATDYLEFERSGNRQIMEQPLNANIGAITNLFLAELAEGKGRFMDQLANGVFQACEMTSWALSAHLVNQSTRRALPDYREQLIDLVSGDLSSLLSWVYYYFHEEFDKIDPSISKRLRHELQTRTMDPYMKQDNFWWMAVNYRPGQMVNNWNPWCNSNVLQTFLLMENDPDKLAAAVYRSMVSVDKFINYTHSDGACEEGPAYWGHAAGKMYDYLQILFDGTGGKINLFNEPMIKNMGEYIVRSYVGNDWVVNFADASAKGGGNADLIYRYGKAVNSDLMMQHAAFLQEKKGKKTPGSGRDMFRTLQAMMYEKEMDNAKPLFQTPAYTWYPETEFCYMSNKNGFFVAAKGGFNNESHNHNDAGTFSLYLNQTPIFIDAGVGTYTRQTFSKERYTIWTMQSNYHNLPMANGYPQSFGSQYKATDVSFNPRRMVFSANIATAYPKEANVNKWVRTYSLSGSGLRIEDKFDITSPQKPNQVNFLVWGNVDITRPGEVNVEVNGQKVTMTYDKNTFSADIETVNLTDPRLSNVWGKEIYRISLNANKVTPTGNYVFNIKKK